VSERPRTAVPIGLLRSGRRWQHLRSATVNCLHYLATGSTLTTVGPFRAGPTVWNSLPHFIRDPTISADSFRRLLKTYLFAQY